MSTNSYICIEKEKGVYEGVRCHWDGCLDYNGVILYEHYQDREKVEKLISLGDMSCLGENVDPNPNKPHSFNEPQDDVCVFYGRDRGESETEPKEVKLEKLNDDFWIEYIYVYTLDNKWKYFETGNRKIKLLDLEEAIKKMK